MREAVGHKGSNGGRSLGSITSCNCCVKPGFPICTHTHVYMNVYLHLYAYTCTCVYMCVYVCILYLSIYNRLQCKMYFLLLFLIRKIKVTLTRMKIRSLVYVQIYSFRRLGRWLNG